MLLCVSFVASLLLRLFCCVASHTTTQTATTNRTQKKRKRNWGQRSPFITITSSCHLSPPSSRLPSCHRATVPSFDLDVSRSLPPKQERKQAIKNGDVRARDRFQSGIKWGSVCLVGWGERAASMSPQWRGFARYHSTAYTQHKGKARDDQSSHSVLIARSQDRKKKKRKQTRLCKSVDPGRLGSPAELCQTRRIDAVSLVVDVAIADKLDVFLDGETKDTEDGFDGFEIADLKVCANVVNGSRGATMKDNVKGLCHVLHKQIVSLVASIAVDAALWGVSDEIKEIKEGGGRQQTISCGAKACRSSWG